MLGQSFLGWKAAEKNDFWDTDSLATWCCFPFTRKPSTEVCVKERRYKEGKKLFWMLPAARGSSAERMSLRVCNKNLVISVLSSMTWEGAPWCIDLLSTSSLPPQFLLFHIPLTVTQYQNTVCFPDTRRCSLIKFHTRKYESRNVRLHYDKALSGAKPCKVACAHLWSVVRTECFPCFNYFGRRISLE